MEENFSEDKKKSLIIKLSRLLKKKYKNVQLIDPKYPFEDYIKLQAISIHANKITFLNAYKNIQNTNIYPKEIKMHKLFTHLNILKVHIKNTMIIEDYIFYCMETCNETLRETMEENRNGLPRELAREILKEIISAISYMQERSYIHLNLNLDNIYLKSNYRIKIGGFELTCKSTPSGIQMPTKIAKYIYTEAPPPEVFIPGEMADYTFDSWSIGYIYYFLLEGKVPFHNQGGRQDVIKNIMSLEYITPKNACKEDLKLLQHTLCYKNDRLNIIDLQEFIMHQKLPNILFQELLLGEYNNLEIIPTGESNICKYKLLRGTNNMTQRVDIIKAYNTKTKYNSKNLDLKRELRIQSKLDHPNIIKIYNTKEISNYRLIFEENYQESVRDILNRGGISIEEARIYIKQIIMGVEHMHKEGIHHLNLKAENIFIVKNNEIKIGDLSMAFEVGVDTGYIYKENIMYMYDIYKPPEILMNEEYGESAVIGIDIWCIGCIYYELMEGELPFTIGDEGLGETLESRIKGLEYDKPKNGNIIDWRLIQHTLCYKDHRFSSTQLMEMLLGEQIFGTEITALGGYIKQGGILLPPTVKYQNGESEEV